MKLEHRTQAGFKVGAKFLWNETENLGAKINFKIFESDINVVFEGR